MIRIFRVDANSPSALICKNLAFLFTGEKAVVKPGKSLLEGASA
jgi:hypothetical protein